jgi:outer membrane protein
VITNKSNYNSQKVQYFDQFKNNYNTSLNLNIRIPIVNAFQARNKVALAKNDVKNNEYLEEIVKVQLRQSIDQAYLNMASASERYKTLLQQVSDFTQSFHSAEVRFNAGVTSQVEYLIAKNNTDRAQINLISAKYDYILRRKILDYYQGKLSL